MAAQQLLPKVVAGEVFPNRYRAEGVAAAQLTARITEGVVSVSCWPLMEFERATALIVERAHGWPALLARLPRFAMAQ